MVRINKNHLVNNLVEAYLKANPKKKRPDDEIKELNEKNKITTDMVITNESERYIYNFFNCMFYQLHCVPHSSSSTQSWGSVLPSIVETRDQNSRGCPLLFPNRNLGSFLCIGDRNPIHPQPLGSCGPLQE